MKEENLICLHGYDIPLSACRFFFPFTVACVLPLRSMNSDGCVVSEVVIRLFARAQMTGNVRNRTNLIMGNIEKDGSYTYGCNTCAQKAIEL
jgi:hypothetical protein